MGNWIANKLIEHDANREIHVFKKFKEGAKQVTYGTFSRTLGTDLVDMVRNKMNYVKDKRSGLTISADEEVKIYRGYYDQKLALVIENNNNRMVFTYEAGHFGG